MAVATNSSGTLKFWKDGLPHKAARAKAPVDSLRFWQNGLPFLAFLPNTYTSALSETLAVSDSVTRTAAYLRSLSESLTVPNDSVATNNAYLQTVTETISVSDSTARTAAYLRAVAESQAAPTDAVSRATDYVRIISETEPTPTDAVSQTAGQARMVAESDAAGPLDAVTRTWSAHRTVTENVSGLADSVSRPSGYSRSTTENVSGLDNLPGWATAVFAYWKMDEPRDSTRYDSVRANGYDALLVDSLGQTRTISGKVGNAIELFGEASPGVGGSYLSVPTLNARTLSQAGSGFTWFGWVLGALGSGQDDIVFEKVDQTGNIELQIRIKFGVGGFTISAQYNGVNATNPTILGSVGLDFVAVHWDATNGLQVDVNLTPGAPVAVGEFVPVPSSPDSSHTYFFVPHAPQTNTLILDEIGIASRAYTIADQTPIFNAGNGTTYPLYVPHDTVTQFTPNLNRTIYELVTSSSLATGIAAYWKFDRVNVLSNPLADSGSNNHTITDLGNAPSFPVPSFMDGPIATGFAGNPAFRSCLDLGSGAATFAGDSSGRELDYGAVPISPGTPNQPFSISLLVKMRASTGTWATNLNETRPLCSTGDRDPGGGALVNGVGIQMRSDGAGNFLAVGSWLDSSGTYQELAIGPILGQPFVDHPYQFNFTFDGTTFRLGQYQIGTNHSAYTTLAGTLQAWDGKSLRCWDVGCLLEEVLVTDDYRVDPLGGDPIVPDAHTLALWHFDSVQVTREATGHGFDLTSLTGCTVIPGKQGNCVQLNGKQFFSTPDTSLLRIGNTDPFSFAVWFRLDALPIGSSMVIFEKKTEGQSGDYGLIVTNVGILVLAEWFVRGSTSNGQVNSLLNLTTGIWYFALCEFDPVAKIPSLSITPEQLLLPSPQVNGLALVGSAMDSAGPLVFGDSSILTARTSPLIGRLDEAGVWRVLLTNTGPGSQAAELFGAGSGNTSPFLPPLDTVSQTAGQARTITEDVTGLLDVITRTVAFHRAVADSVPAATDAVVHSVHLLITVTETTLTPVDAVTRSIVYQRSLAESLPFTIDTVSSSVIFQRSLAESLPPVSDTVLRGFVAHRIIQESLPSPTDTVSYQMTAPPSHVFCVEAAAVFAAGPVASTAYAANAEASRTFAAGSEASVMECGD